MAWMVSVENVKSKCSNVRREISVIYNVCNSFHGKNAPACDVGLQKQGKSCSLALWRERLCRVSVSSLCFLFHDEYICIVKKY